MERLYSVNELFQILSTPKLINDLLKELECFNKEDVIETKEISLRCNGEVEKINICKNKNGVYGLPHYTSKRQTNK